MVDKAQFMITYRNVKSGKVRLEDVEDTILTKIILILNEEASIVRRRIKNSYDKIG